MPGNNSILQFLLVRPLGGISSSLEYFSNLKSSLYSKSKVDMSRTKTINMLGTVMNVGYRLGYIPYRYDKGKGKASFDASTKQKLRLGLNVILLGLYELLLVFRYVQVLVNPSAGAGGGQRRIRGLYLSLIYICCNFNQYITLRHYGSQHVFFNEFVSASAQMTESCSWISQRTVVKERKLIRYNRRNQNAMIGGLFSLILISMTRALRVLLHPESPEMPTSLAADPRSLPWWVKCCLGLLQLNITGFLTYMITLHGCVIITYIFSVIPILEELKLKYRPSMDAARLSQTIRRIHPQLSILQRNFDNMYGVWPFGFEVICGVLVIMRLFLALSLRSVKDFMTAACMLSTIVMVFGGFADVHDISVEAESSWSVLLRPEWFQKYRRSCTPISISVGGFFFADKQLILTIISIIVANTTSLLLASRNSSA